MHEIRLCLFLFLLVPLLGSCFPPSSLAAGPSLESGPGLAAALLSKGDCEAARTAFLALASPRGPLVVAGVQEAFGQPCSVDKAKNLPRSFEAVALAERDKLVEAAALFEALAREGDRPAALMSLDFSLAGNKTAPNPAPPPGLAQAQEDYQAWRYDTAMPVIRRFADQGDPVACFLLGRDFLWGVSGKRDVTQATTWFERAAAQGHPRAKVMLAFLLGEERGLARDKERSSALLRQAMAQGDGDAYHEMGRLLVKESPDDLPPLAIFYFGQSAQQGFTWSMYGLAMFLEESGLPALLPKAAHWLVQTAEIGYPQACRHLAEMYETGRVVPQDFERAAYWYGQCTNNRYEALAKYRLALLYRDGRGVLQDLAEAFYWSHLAAMHGQAEAQELDKELEARLSPETLAAARRRAEKWTPSPPGPWAWR